MIIFRKTLGFCSFGILVFLQLFQFSVASAGEHLNSGASHEIEALFRQEQQDISDDLIEEEIIVSEEDVLISRLTSMISKKSLGELAGEIYTYGLAEPLLESSNSIELTGYLNYLVTESSHPARTRFQAIWIILIHNRLVSLDQMQRMQETQANVLDILPFSPDPSDLMLDLSQVVKGIHDTVVLQKLNKKKYPWSVNKPSTLGGKTKQQSEFEYYFFDQQHARRRLDRQRMNADLEDQKGYLRDMAFNNSRKKRAYQAEYIRYLDWFTNASDLEILNVLPGNTIARDVLFNLASNRDAKAINILIPYSSQGNDPEATDILIPILEGFMTLIHEHKARNL